MPVQSGRPVVRGQLIMDPEESRIPWTRVTAFLRLWIEIASFGMELCNIPPVELKFYPAICDSSVAPHEFTVILTYSTDKERRKKAIRACLESSGPLLRRPGLCKVHYIGSAHRPAVVLSLTLEHMASSVRCHGICPFCGEIV